MDVIQLLGVQLRTAHQWLEGAVGTATEQELRWFPPSDAYPAGVCYAHAVATEDMIVGRLLKGAAPLAVSSWVGRTGLSEPMPNPGPEWRERSAHWTRAVRINLPEFQAYAQAVYAESELYVSSLHPADLDYEIDLSGIGIKKQPLAWVLSTLVIAHLHGEIGEISVVKSLQGLPGFPVGH